MAALRHGIGQPVVLLWVATSRSPWLGGVVRPPVWLIAVERPLREDQRSVDPPDAEWQLLAAAVFGPRNLADRSQSEVNVQAAAATVRTWPTRSVEAAVVNARDMCYTEH